MADFNYQKAYFTQARPAFEALNPQQRTAFSVVSELVADLSQDRKLLIPMPYQARQVLEWLTCGELADLSCASYFVGHWKPGHAAELFDNSKGQSWKVANCCDQVLRSKLNPPKRIEIHEGNLRFTFSSPDCWMWNEFGRATEDNLATFNRLKGTLPVGADNFDQACDILKSACGDLWPSVDDAADNADYAAYLADCKQRLIQKQHDDYRNTINNLDQKKLDALLELNFKLLCIERDLDIDNLIYYSHKHTFCFGWREPIDAKTAENIRSALDGCGYEYEIKGFPHA